MMILSLSVFFTNRAKPGSASLKFPRTLNMLSGLMSACQLAQLEVCNTQIIRHLPVVFLALTTSEFLKIMYAFYSVRNFE
jgi:hypothetical protein